MDGLHVPTAAPWKQMIGGKEYWMGPLTLEDWGMLEKRLVASRPDPLELAISRLERHDDLDEHTTRGVLECAFRETMEAHRATVVELKQFMRGVEGFSLMLWLSLRKHQPGITEERAGELALQLGGDALESLQAEIDGTSSAEPAKN